jgi:hypothetical protein
VFDAVVAVIFENISESNDIAVDVAWKILAGVLDSRLSAQVNHARTPFPYKHLSNAPAVGRFRLDGAKTRVPRHNASRASRSDIS